MGTLVATILALMMNLGVSALAEETTTAEADLAAGIAQVKTGDFERAVSTLTQAAYRLSLAKDRGRELSRAYTYLAMAYFGLARVQEAKSELLEAWKADRDLTLSTKEFPADVVDLYEQMRREAEARENRMRASATAAPRPNGAPGGARWALPMVGVAVGGAAGVVVKRNSLKAPAATPTTVAPSPTATATPSVAGTWALSENGSGGIDTAALSQSGDAITGTLTRGFSTRMSDLTGTIDASANVLLHEQRGSDPVTCDFTGKLDSLVTISGTEACSNGLQFSFVFLKR